MRKLTENVKKKIKRPSFKVREFERRLANAEASTEQMRLAWVEERERNEKLQREFGNVLHREQQYYNIVKTMEAITPIAIKHSLMAALVDVGLAPKLPGSATEFNKLLQELNLRKEKQALKKVVKKKRGRPGRDVVSIGSVRYG